MSERLTDTAENPAPLITPLHPVFFPLVISVKPEVALLYNQGFKNPRVDFPDANLSLFRS
jgi:hypothetical protein